MSFIDGANLPVGGIRYILTYPDNSKAGGVLGGQIKRLGVPQGNYTVKLQGIVNAQWSTQQADVGQAVTIQVDTVGFDNGEEAVLQIFVRDGNYTDHQLAILKTTVNNDSVSQQWTMEVDEKYLSICDAKATKKKYSRPFFFYRVTVGGSVEQSGILEIKDSIEISIVDEQNNPCANERIKVALPSGEIKEEQVDGSGKKKLEKLPPGKYSIRFPN
jgi:hypothetical protein